MNEVLLELGDGMTCAALDGKHLQFRSTFRPRARYLYYSYCLQILRLAFKERHQGKILREQELEKPFWGSPGEFVKKYMLSFIEEVGHRYDNLLEGTIEPATQNQSLRETIAMSMAMMICCFSQPPGTLTSTRV